MARVAHPAGAVIACVWDRSQMPLLQAFWDSAEAVAPAEAHGVRRKQQVGAAGPEYLADRFAAAGLTAIRTGAVEASARYDGFADLWAPLAAGIGRSGALCASLDAPRRNRLAAAVRERLAAPDEPFTLTARAWYATARPAR